VNPDGYGVDDGVAVRPALLLNLASVLFVSDASGASAKSLAGEDGCFLPAHALGGGAVKFTFVDSALALGGLTTTGRDGDVVEFSYTGATPGKTLSAVVLSSGGAVKYYGKLAATSASGTAFVILPDDFDEADTVQIFVEECNGDNESDFASAYKQLTIPATGGGGTGDYFKLWGKTTTYSKSLWYNWILLIFCFGWIWMAF